MVIMSVSKDELSHIKIFDGKKVLNENYELIKDNVVHKEAFVDWNNITIGTGNIIGPFSLIGSQAQHKFYETAGKICIGNNNVFHAFCNISSPSTLKGKTLIGNNNYIMSHSMIHHDCIIEDDTIICSNVSIAGHVQIMNGAYLGQNSSVHQFQVIGSYSILGMNSCVIKKSKITPGQKFAGVPCRKIGLNSIALERNEVNAKLLLKEKKRFNKLKKQMDELLFS